MQAINQVIGKVVNLNQTVRDKSDSRERQGSCDKEVAKKAVWLWVQLESIYPAKWVKAVGNAVGDDGKASVNATNWIAAVNDFQREDILQALGWLLVHERLKSWIPTLGEFVDLCQQAQRQRLLSDAASRTWQQLTREKRTKEEYKAAAEKGLKACWESLRG